VRAFPTDATDARMRVIKTGDRGLSRSDGLIELVGRKDLQTKLRGHRIYPSEIERALRDYVGVSDAAIVVRMNKSGVPRCLVAYVELQKTGRGLPSQDIIAMLERSLPVYMIPSAIFAIDQLPRLPSLKLDRSRLQEIDSERMKGAAGGWDDPLLREVARIFEQVIGIAGAMPDDNVASLGGDSLQAVNIALELETRFRVAIPTEIFKGMLAIRELAQWIVSHNPAARQVCTASPRPDSS